MVRIWLLAGVGTIFTEEKKGTVGDEKGIYIYTYIYPLIYNIYCLGQEGRPS